MTTDTAVHTVYYLCFFTALWLTLYSRTAEWLRWAGIVAACVVANAATLLHLYTHPNM